MEKRIPLAFLLSFVILFGWNFLFGRKTPPGTNAGESTHTVDDVPPAGLTAEEGADDGATNGAAIDPPPVDEAEPWQEWVELGVPGQPGHYHALFDNRGAQLLDLHLGDYWVRRDLTDTEKRERENCMQLASGVESMEGVLGSFRVTAKESVDPFTSAPLQVARWDASVIEEDGVNVGVEFVHDGGKGVVFTKRVRVEPGRYELLYDLELGVQEGVSASGRLGFDLVPAMGVPPASDDSFYVEPTARAAFRKNGDLILDSEQREFSGDERRGAFPPNAGETAFIGVDNKYFAMLMRGADEYATRSIQGTSWQRVWDPAWVRDHPTEQGDGFRFVSTIAHLQLELPTPGQSNNYTYAVYAGPKSRAVLEQHNPDHVALVKKDLGFFNGIAGLLLRILGWFHSLAGNWGVSIILLTLAVRLALFPFNRKSQTAMARHATKMKRVQPMLNELKEKYAKDPKKLREEQAQIMSAEGAFPPLGGCLPMFVQIPIFFGLFSALRTSFELRQAPFLGWIQDLSAPDQFMKFGSTLPFFGDYLNILPPAMVVLWILQQKVMPKPTDEQALRMQRMMMFMPILFGFFLYNYAAGLSLYMITTSLFGIMEMTVIKKIWPLDTTEQPKKKSGFMSRLAQLQEEAQRMQQAKAQGKSAGARANPSGNRAQRRAGGGGGKGRKK
ncbi:MAG: membrane protein insertase YidC [bacterium]|nr:membrane protein insertase YidC [bacterium]